MDAGWLDLPELRDLGEHVRRARRARGYSQERLSRECGLSQAHISLFEAGRRLPSLDQFVRLARVLDVPLQRLLTGSDRPGLELRDLAVELRGLGGGDLWIADALVPGAARRPEEVIAVAAAGRNPDPRIIETLPALLSWNVLSPALLRAHAARARTSYRLAWLADVALTIDRRRGFPGGCRRDSLGRFLERVEPPPKTAAWDDLGRPSEKAATSPIWRRWKIGYGAKVDDFESRARALLSVRPAEMGLSGRNEGTTLPKATPSAPKARNGKTDGR